MLEFPRVATPHDDFADLEARIPEVADMEDNSSESESESGSEPESEEEDPSPYETNNSPVVSEKKSKQPIGKRVV